MDIAPKSEIRQQIAEIERQSGDNSNLTAVTTKSTNVHGDQMVVTTTSPHEQKLFSSKTDWRYKFIFPFASFLLPFSNDINFF